MLDFLIYYVHSAMLPRKNGQIGGGIGYSMYMNTLLYSTLSNVASKKRANRRGYKI